MIKNQKGFSAVQITVLAVILILVGLVGYNIIYNRIHNLPSQQKARMQAEQILRGINPPGQLIFNNVNYSCNNRIPGEFFGNPPTSCGVSGLKFYITSQKNTSYVDSLGNDLIKMNYLPQITDTKLSDNIELFGVTPAHHTTSFEYDYKGNANNLKIFLSIVFDPKDMPDVINLNHYLQPNDHKNYVYGIDFYITTSVSN